MSSKLPTSLIWTTSDCQGHQGSLQMRRKLQISVMELSTVRAFRLSAACAAIFDVRIPHPGLQLIAGGQTKTQTRFEYGKDRRYQRKLKAELTFMTKQKSRPKFSSIGSFSEKPDLCVNPRK
jgi:hypothetical protein